MNCRSCRVGAMLALPVVAAALGLYALLAWTAVQDKSATFDEPLHTAAAWAIRHQRDFRVNPEDPNLWQYWAALPLGTDALSFDPADGNWNQMLGKVRLHWPWAAHVLYQDQRGLRAVQQARVMMLILAVVAGLVVAAWSWRLAGPVAAVAGALLFAFDPNFLGHGPLVKNDVALSLLTVAAAWATWSMGRRLTLANLSLFALLCGALVSTKFSGLLIVPLLGLLLLLRALQSSDWDALGRLRRTRWSRLGMVVVAMITASAISHVMIWALYGFRFAPSPDGQTINMQRPVEEEAYHRLLRQNPNGDFPYERVRQVPPSLPTRLLLRIERYRLAPQTYIAGLLYMRAWSLSRDSYLLGNITHAGSASYFPITLAAKTPTATLLAGGLALAGAIWLWRRRGQQESAQKWWTVLCVLLVPVVYLLIAMGSSLNLGLRHMLPVYPLLYVGIAAAAAKLLGCWPKTVTTLGVLLVLGLAAESLRAFPNYIAFFNTPADQGIGRLELLGDSNLDWGQDLPALKRWQEQNPQRRLYLAYFGICQPRAYGIRFIDAPGTTRVEMANDLPGRPTTLPAAPGDVLAVSATLLQGLYLTPHERQYYDQVRQCRPLAVLNHTIYLYEWSP